MKQTADSELAREVLAQIRERPDLYESNVSVAVDQGVVMLSGVVSAELEREAIEAATMEVWGVQAIANELLVKPIQEQSDVEIAKAALTALHNQILIPASDIIVIV